MPGKKKVEDNWSEILKCKSCRAFIPKKRKIGRCRRHAPTIMGFPVVYETDWCLEHKLDEDKVETED